MRSKRGWIAMAGVLLTLAVAVAADTLPVPPVARVTDTTGTLTAAQKQSLDATLTAIEKNKGSQVAVLIVPTTQPEDIEQYAYRVADAWKLGRKGVDDGVLLTVAKDDHKVRIDVGRGLEGAIPDATTARLIREYITPKFRTGDIAGGIDDAVGAIGKLIDGEALPPPLESGRLGGGDANGGLFNAIIFSFFAALWLRSMFGGLPSAPRGAAVALGAGALAWFLSGVIGAAFGMGIFGLIVGLVGGSGGGFANRGGWGGWGGGGFGGGGFGGGGFGGGGGFSGGGGGFSGGGASGSW